MQFVTPPPLSQEHVDGAQLLADRIGLIRRLVRPRLVVAEIGVAFGDFSRVILEILQPARFDAFDVFQFDEIEAYQPRLNGLTHVEFYKSRFAASDPVSFHIGDSSVELAKKPDQSYDVIYIDGDHSLEGVRRDAAVAVCKIRADGVLIFNDYKMADHLSNNFPYGIVPVVNDLCVNHGWRVTHFALQNQMFCDVAIRRRAYALNAMRGDTNAV